MSQRFYVTNAIAYVNGDPHLGHALEFVQTDVLARHRRLRGEQVRYLSGTYATTRSRTSTPPRPPASGWPSS